MEAISRRKSLVRLVPVTGELVNRYCQIGREAYSDHYLHLWLKNNPSPYFQEHLNPKKVIRDISDSNLDHYLVYSGDQPTGILKLVLNAPFGSYKASEALLLEKIYLLAAFTGKGLGSQVIQKVNDIARGHKKRLIWLDTMQKGPAINFYLKCGFHIAGTTSLSLPGVFPRESGMYILVKELE